MQTQAAIWTKQDSIYTSVHGATVRKVSKLVDRDAATGGKWMWRAGERSGHQPTLSAAKSACEQVRRGWR